MSFKDLFAPKWKNSKVSVRLTAVKELDDQNILMEVARTDSELPVKVAAIMRLNLSNLQSLSKETFSDTSFAKTVNLRWKDLAFQTLEKYVQIHDWQSFRLLSDSFSDQEDILDILSLLEDTSKTDIHEYLLQKLPLKQRFKLIEKNPNHPLVAQVIEQTADIAYLQKLQKQGLNKTIRNLAKDRIDQIQGLSEEEKRVQLVQAQLKAFLVTPSMDVAPKLVITADQTLELFNSPTYKGHKNPDQHPDRQHTVEEFKVLHGKVHEWYNAATSTQNLFNHLFKEAKQAISDDAIASYNALKEVQLKWELEKKGNQFNNLLTDLHHQFEELWLNTQKSYKKALKQAEEDQKREKEEQRLAQKAAQLAERKASLHLKSTDSQTSNVDSNQETSEPSLESKEKKEPVNSAKLLEDKKKAQESLKELFTMAKTLGEQESNTEFAKAFKELQFNFNELNKVFGRNLWNFVDNTVNRADWEEVQSLLYKKISDYEETRKWESWSNSQQADTLIQRLKGLVTLTPVEGLSQKVQELMTEWKSLGSFSQEGSKERWNMFKELHDSLLHGCADAKQKILEQLKETLPIFVGAEKKELSDDELKPFLTKEVADQVKELQKQFKAIGSLPKYVEKGLSQDFYAICDRLFSIKKEIFANYDIIKEENAKRAQEIIRKVKSLVSNEKLPIKEKLNGIKSLQDEFRDIRPLPKEQISTLNEAFKAETDVVFAKLDEQRQQNLVEKQQLIEKVNTLLAEKDNQAHSLENIFKQLQSEFKDIGPVPKEHEQSIWEQFNSPIHAYFENRKNEGKQILEKKRQPLQTLLANAPKDSISVELEKVNTLRQELKSFGFADPAQEKNITRQLTCYELFAKGQLTTDPSTLTAETLSDNFSKRQEQLLRLNILYRLMQPNEKHAELPESQLSESLKLGMEYRQLLNAGDHEYNHERILKEANKLFDEWQKPLSIENGKTQEVYRSFIQLVNKFYVV